MPRLSLWKPQRSLDYRFQDNTIREMFTVGGTDVNIHKYIGPDTTNNDGSDPTQPAYETQSEKNIEDLLFLENRDRKYDSSIYQLRCIYNVQDIDFDLSQFGLFLQNDTLFILFHINDMVEGLGRRLINGDVLELPHMRDFYPLDSELPAALRRYYVVQDGNKAAEGFSPTWFPHLWRVKCTPLIDSQEFRDIFHSTALKQDGSEVKNTNMTADSTDFNASDSDITADVGKNNRLKDLISTFKQEMDINKAIIEQAENEVPESGYDVSSFFVVPTDKDGNVIDNSDKSADSTTVDASNTLVTADQIPNTPKQNAYKGYMTGDGLAPNGYPVTPARAWPIQPTTGEYVLRLDFTPNRLFRFDGNRWVKIEDNIRTSLTFGKGSTRRDRFVNNTSTYTDEDGNVKKSKQNLSDILKPEADE